jgi:sugar/nucleoside kinase (ribokinase family)
MIIEGIGHCTLKHIAHVKQLPKPDDLTEIPQFSTQGAGPIANAIVALARWGSNTRFTGRVGDDYRGKEIVDLLEDEGIDASNVRRLEERVSPLAFTLVKQPEASIRTLFTRGNVGDISPEDIEVPLASETRLLINRDESAAALELLDTAENPVHMLTLVSDPSKDIPLERTDTVVCSEHVASRFTGTGQLDKICQKLLDRGPETAIVNLGLDGAVGLSKARSKPVRIEGQGIEITDTLGGRDVFVGAVAYGTVRNWSLEKVIRFAHGASLENCKGVGPRSYIPEAEAVLDSI